MLPFMTPKETSATKAKVRIPIVVGAKRTHLLAARMIRWHTSGILLTRLSATTVAWFTCFKGSEQAADPGGPLIGRDRA
jgi:hypothetical protein